MITTLKTTTIITALFAALMTVVLLASPTYAGPLDSQDQTAVAQTQIAPAMMTLAAKFKAPTRRSRVKCNGQTTDDCCKGLSKCSCLYMPGSSSTNHPTACFSTKKSSSRNRS